MADLATILKQDHRKLDSMLDELADAGDSEQEELIDEIEQAFERHARLEEQYVYPHVDEDLGDEEFEEANAEHELARQGIEQLRAMAGKPGFGALVDMLKAGIEHHVHEEEREILPQLKRSMDRDEWRELSDEVAERHEAAENGDDDGGSGSGRRATGGRKGSTRRASSSSGTGSRSNGRTNGTNGSGRSSRTASRSTTGTGSRSGGGRRSSR